MSQLMEYSTKSALNILPVTPPYTPPLCVAQCCLFFPVSADLLGAPTAMKANAVPSRKD